MSSSSNNVSESPRFQSDLRQLGGILFVFSVCALVFPLIDTTGLITGNGTTASTSLQMAMLIGDLCVVALGLLGMGIAYLLLVCDYGSANLTLFAIVWEQTVFIEWISKMINTKNAPFATDDAEGRFFRSMGVMTMFTLCVLFYGAIGLILFTIYSYQTGNYQSRNAGYYRGRMVFYGLLFMGLGVFRFLAQGSYILATMGGGRLDAPVGVVGGMIWYPAIEIFLGITFVGNGLHAMARGLSLVRPSKEGDRFFQYAIALNFVLYIILVVLVEFSLTPGPHPGAPVVTVVMVNGHLLLAFLDEKAQSTPETLTDAYYLSSSVDTKDGTATPNEQTKSFLLDEEESEDKNTEGTPPPQEDV